MAGTFTPADLIQHDPLAVGTSETWLREQLERHGIRLQRGTPLDLAFANLRNFRKSALEGLTLYFGSNGWTFDRQPLPSGTDGWSEHHRLYAQAVGADFLSKAVHWAATCGLDLPIERWRHLVKGDCNPFVPVPAEKSSKGRNQVWETVVACLAQTFATNVRFDEPDVVCQFDGEEFAIAAKVPYSAKQFIPRLKEGVQQVRRHGRPGLVFANIASAYPLEQHFRDSVARFAVATPAEIRDACINDVTLWCSALNLKALKETLEEDMTLPVGTACFVSLMSYAGQTHQAIPFLYPHFPIAWAESGADYRFVTAFLHACQSVLGFTTD